MEKGDVSKPARHPKGWGYEDWIANSKDYCGKVLHFNKGKRCSIHFHKIKDETFYLLSGRLEIKLSDSESEYAKGKIKTIIMEKGDVLHIWLGRVHQMKAIEESDLIEISTQHFEEDSYRIEKGD